MTCNLLIFTKASGRNLEEIIFIIHDNTELHQILKYRKSAFFHSQNIFVFSKKTKIFYIKYSKTFIYAYIRIKLFQFQQK